MLAITAAALAFATWSGVEPTVLRPSKPGGPKPAESWAFRSRRSRILALSSADRRVRLVTRSRPVSAVHLLVVSQRRVFHKGRGRLTGPRGVRGGGTAPRPPSPPRSPRTP